MQKTSIETEAKKILETNGDNLVLIKSNDDSVFSIVDKTTHFMSLIDDEDLYNLLVSELSKRGTEVFTSFLELENKYPKQLIKPLFWPEDRPWPPQR